MEFLVDQYREYQTKKASLQASPTSPNSGNLQLYLTLSFPVGFSELHHSVIQLKRKNLIVALADVFRGATTNKRMAEANKKTLNFKRTGDLVNPHSKVRTLLFGTPRVTTLFCRDTSLREHELELETTSRKPLKTQIVLGNR
jgi:hypothetical protein